MFVKVNNWGVYKGRRPININTFQAAGQNAVHKIKIKKPLENPSHLKFAKKTVSSEESEMVQIHGMRCRDWVTQTVVWLYTWRAFCG